MIVGVPREFFPGERRVALVPAVLPSLAKVGLEVMVEAGAGAQAGYPDADFAAKGAKIIADRAEVFRTATSWCKCSGMAPTIATDRATFVFFTASRF